MTSFTFLKFFRPSLLMNVQITMAFVSALTHPLQLHPQLPTSCPMLPNSECFSKCNMLFSAFAYAIFFIWNGFSLLHLTNSYSSPKAQFIISTKFSWHASDLTQAGLSLSLSLFPSLCICVCACAAILYWNFLFAHMTLTQNLESIIQSDSISEIFHSVRPTYQQLPQFLHLIQKLLFHSHRICC